jgi:ATP synthase F1 complex assembly factor 2
MGLSTTNALRGLPHSPLALNLAETFLLSLDAWRLAAMQAATMEAKSFIIGMALTSGSLNSHIQADIPFADDTAKAVVAARIEEEFQIESWGLVEGQHDYDRLNSSIQIHSAVLLSNCVNATILEN